jgi:hypothetical protein
MEGDMVSAQRVMEAAPEVIFAVVADVSRHPQMDGSGTVRKPKPGAPESLSLGSVFGMSMRVGVGYSTRNTVVEFEDGRRIAWQTCLPGVRGRILGGPIWRYELEPIEGGTQVRESWDISKARTRFLLRMGPLPGQTLRNMEKTLERIAQITSSEGPEPAAADSPEGG